jgi:hypothetical protein
VPVFVCVCLSVYPSVCFATVFKAEDLAHDGRIVAVKKIKIGRREEARDGIQQLFGWYNQSV